jgi:hypothetical protein
LIWQDYAILAAQGVMLAALVPTLRDRAAWLRLSTCLLTGSALAGMAATFVTLELWLATAVTFGSAAVWLRMAAR